MQEKKSPSDEEGEKALLHVLSGNALSEADKLATLK